MSTPYRCKAPGRVDVLRAAALASPPRLFNGIDYLEVAPGQRRLQVHFVHSLNLVPALPLTLANVEIRGGVRIRDPRVTGIAWQDEVLVVDVAQSGDFSRYVLRLVASPGVAAPPEGVDPALAQIEFSFKVDCPSDLDCRSDSACPPIAVQTKSPTSRTPWALRPISAPRASASLFGVTHGCSTLPCMTAATHAPG